MLKRRMGLEGGSEVSGNAFACFLYGEWRNEESLHKPLIEGVIAKERYNKQECNSLTINKKMVVVESGFQRLLALSSTSYKLCKFLI